MSATPLTDAEAGYPDGSGCWKYNDLGLYVDADFARDLELKLNAAREDAERLAKNLTDFIYQYGCSCGHPYCRSCWRTEDAKEALEQHEKLKEGE